MKTPAFCLPAGLIAIAALALPTQVLAAPARVQCTVNINYQSDAAAVPYNKTFEITRAEPFVDDFSTATRQREFSAALSRADGLIVSIDYFNDVEVFGSISFATSLQVRGVDVPVSTSGVFDYANSSSLPAGRHFTTWDLTCHRMDPLAP